MTERDEILISISETIADYRSGEIDPASPDHVDRWIRQFDTDVQMPILRELDYVFKRTYVSKYDAKRLLRGIVTKYPGDFWSQSRILNIQQDGNSQSDMIELMKPILLDEHAYSVEIEPNSAKYSIYLDDAIFTGNRIISDLSNWRPNELMNTTALYIFVFSLHTSGRYWIEKNKAKFSSHFTGKPHFACFPKYKFESRRTYRNSSHVLWPTKETYSQDNFAPRLPGASDNRVFSSESGRQLLEKELLNAGCRIRGFASEPSPVLKPLGFSNFQPGFGSLFVTYRNCPNNAPLALWYGDPGKYPTNHPLGKWYPLLPRRYADDGTLDPDPFADLPDIKMGQ